MKTTEWLKILEDTAADLGARHVTYKMHGSRAGMIRENGTTNCVGYVMEALYNAGLLRKGSNFWLGRRIHGRSAFFLKMSPKFWVFYPKKTPARLKLRKGDICGFQWGFSFLNHVHTMVYAGEEEGRALWYSFSPVEERNGWTTGPAPQPDFDDRKVMVLIRIKKLK